MFVKLHVESERTEWDSTRGNNVWLIVLCCDIKKICRVIVRPQGNLSRHSWWFVYLYLLVYDNRGQHQSQCRWVLALTGTIACRWVLALTAVDGLVC